MSSYTYNRVLEELLQNYDRVTEYTCKKCKICQEIHSNEKERRQCRIDESQRIENMYEMSSYAKYGFDEEFY